MKSLFKWQVVSFLSRSMAMAIGLFQSFIILRLLSQSEWGLVQLALSIGGTIGIYQNLGLASASTREIASTKDDSKVFKIFLTSVLIRYIVALPLGLGLIFLAPKIANDIYEFPLLIIPLQIYGTTILIQGFQTILNSVISGTKRFKQLFTYQVIISFVSFLLYIPLVYYYKMMGYFYAFFIFNLINTISLSIIAFKPLKATIQIPSKSDFLMIFKEIFSITLIIFIAKIIYTNWEKFGNNILGLTLDEAGIAIFAFAVMFAKKIMTVSDSVTDVSLPILSQKFIEDIKDFINTFVTNFNKIFVFVIISSFTALFWSQQIVYILAGQEKFNEFYQSFSLMLPLLLAFIIYSFINIVNSSILIPAKMIKSIVLSFTLLLLSTAFSYYLFYTYKFNNLMLAMSLSMLIGTVISFVYMNFSIKSRFNFYTINFKHILIVFLFTLFSSLNTFNNLYIKSGTFLALFFVMLAFMFLFKFITKQEVSYLKNKILSKKFNIIKGNG